MAKRDFLQITDFSRKEIEQLFDLAKRMKGRAYRETPLDGKTLAMIFAKSSTRTRVSFEVGAYQLGGQALFLSSRDIQIGRGEPIPDTARVLSRYVDGIMIRTFDHAEVEELARHASIPVINGDRKSTRLNSSHLVISYAVFCLKKKKSPSADTIAPHAGGTRSGDVNKWSQPQMHFFCRTVPQFKIDHASLDAQRSRCRSGPARR